MGLKNLLIEERKLMDGILNKEMVVCCLCGKSLPLEAAVVLKVWANEKSEEYQVLYSHKSHFVRALDKSVILHPDLLEPDALG